MIHDLSDDSFSVVNQDSASVDFPGDFEGDILVVGFIYTHCPNICSVITANMKNISRSLQDTESIRFVEISFDPARDTPSVLRAYMEKFRLDEDTFTLLTGDSSSISPLLESMDIKTEKADSSTAAMDHGSHGYIMNHSDRILIIDRRGRVRFTYPGSVVPPEMVTEDINRIW